MENSKRKLSVQRLFVTQAFDDYMQTLLKPSMNSLAIKLLQPKERRGVAPLEEVASLSCRMDQLFGKGPLARRLRLNRLLRSQEPRGPVQ